MRDVVLGSLVEYPAQQIEAALADTAEQLVMVASGEGVITSIWHTYGIIDRYLPSIGPVMRAARQQHGELSFDTLNALHVPVALMSMLALPWMIWFGRRNDFSDLAGLATTVAIALLANAAVCGTLSGPHDRYGARLVWIATFALALAWMRLRTRVRQTCGH